MDGNWMDCNNCRRSYKRTTTHANRLETATDVGAHGMRQKLDHTLPVKERIEAAYAALHAAAPVMTGGEAIQEEVRRFFDREAASIRGNIAEDMSNVVAEAKKRLDERVGQATKAFFASPEFERLISRQVQIEAKAWLDRNLRDRIQLTVSANVSIPQASPIKAA